MKTIDDLMKPRDEERLNREVRRAGNAGIEAYGVKGFKRMPWRKAFKSVEELNKWAEKNDAEVHGTRSTAEDRRAAAHRALDAVLRARDASFEWTCRKCGHTIGGRTKKETFNRADAHIYNKHGGPHNEAIRGIKAKDAESVEAVQRQFEREGYVLRHGRKQASGNYQLVYRKPGPETEMQDIAFLNVAGGAPSVKYSPAKAKDAESVEEAQRRAAAHRALDRVLDRAKDEMTRGEYAARNWEERLLIPLATAAENARDARVRRMYEADLDTAKRAVDKLRIAKDERSFNVAADQLRYIARKNRL